MFCIVSQAFFNAYGELYSERVVIMTYKVKNIPHTSNRKIPTGYSCWLDYWESNMGQHADKCACCGYDKKRDLVGAHVYCPTISGHLATCIVPLCKSCNQIPADQAFHVNIRPIVIQ